MEESKNPLKYFIKREYPREKDEQIEEIKNDAFTAAAKQARAERMENPLTPVYHYITSYEFMNDPNGLCFWRGNWHLFYQQFQSGIVYWGHAVSKDLVHWKELPYAISPDPENGEQSCWSGSICTENGVAAALYYGQGGKIGLYCQTADDDLLLNWKRTTKGPSFAGNTEQPDWRRVPYAVMPEVYDSCIFYRGGKYYGLSAGVSRRSDGTVRREEYLISSTDLKNWKYEHPFLSGDGYGSVGDDGACPYLVPIGSGKNDFLLLFYSHRNGAEYMIGNLDEERMILNVSGGERLNTVSKESGYYAPAACADQSESGVARAIYVMHCAGFYSCMSLPHKLYAKSSRISVVPSPELETLRKNHRVEENIVVPRGKKKSLKFAYGTATEIDLTLCFTSAVAEIRMFESDDGKNYASATVMRERGEQYRDQADWHRENLLTLDCLHASAEGEIAPSEAVSFPSDGSGSIKLKIFIDKSVIEIFTLTGKSIGKRILPHAGAEGFSVTAHGGQVQIVRADVWDMENVNQLADDWD